MDFFTYILQLNDKSFYTGITNNLARRIIEHQSGKSKSTKRNLPVKLCHYWTFKTRKESRLLEVKIKNRGAKKFLEQYRGLDNS